MVTDKDVKKIVKASIEEGKKVFLTKADIAGIVAAMRNEFVTKQELVEFKEEMRVNFAAVLSILDSMAKRMDEFQMEMKAHNAQLNRHERWNHEIADDIGFKLEY